MVCCIGGKWCLGDVVGSVLVDDVCGVCFVGGRIVLVL